jgi:hypothetical protein
MLLSPFSVVAVERTRRPVCRSRAFALVDLDGASNCECRPPGGDAASDKEPLPSNNG